MQSFVILFKKPYISLEEYAILKASMLLKFWNFRTFWWPITHFSEQNAAKVLKFQSFWWQMTHFSDKYA